MKPAFVFSVAKKHLITAFVFMGAVSAHADCIPAYRQTLIELKNQVERASQIHPVASSGGMVESRHDASTEATREKAQDVELVLRLLMQARKGEGDQFDLFLEKVSKVVGVPHVDSTAVQLILFDASSGHTLCPVSRGLVRDERRLMSEAEVINFVAEQINRFGRECSWSDCSTIGHRIVP